MTEEQMKEQYLAGVWWLRFPKMFATLGQAMSLKREVDYYTDELLAMKAKYAPSNRKGRKPGSKNKPKAPAGIPDTAAIEAHEAISMPDVTANNPPNVGEFGPAPASDPVQDEAARHRAYLEGFCGTVCKDVPDPFADEPGDDL